MNSKILVTIVITISAILGMYIGAKQVSNEKDSNKYFPTLSNDIISNSGDENISGDTLISGDIQLSGDISGEISNNVTPASGDNDSISIVNTKKNASRKF